MAYNRIYCLDEEKGKPLESLALGRLSSIRWELQSLIREEEAFKKSVKAQIDKLKAATPTPLDVSVKVRQIIDSEKRRKTLVWLHELIETLLNKKNEEVQKKWDGAATHEAFGYEGWGD
jgi:hypothetical protein